MRFWPTLLVTAAATLSPTGSSPECIATGSGYSISGSPWDNLPIPLFRFNQLGTLDKLTLTLTTRGQFDKAIPCSLEVLIENAEPALCGPDLEDFGVNLLTGTHWTTEQGEAILELSRVGGRGQFDLEVWTTQCCHLGKGGVRIKVVDETILFTTPDQDGSCEPADIVDLGIWASCLPPGPWCLTSDFWFDGTVDVVDLSIWASGL